MCVHKNGQSVSVRGNCQTVFGLLDNLVKGVHMRPDQCIVPDRMIAARSRLYKAFLEVCRRAGCPYDKWQPGWEVMTRPQLDAFVRVLVAYRHEWKIPLNGSGSSRLSVLCVCVQRLTDGLFGLWFAAAGVAHSLFSYAAYPSNLVRSWFAAELPELAKLEADRDAQYGTYIPMTTTSAAPRVPITRILGVTTALLALRCLLGLKARQCRSSKRAS